MAKRILSILLAVMLLATMVVGVSADDPITITIENAAENHVYEAYQVFSGTLSESGVLSDVEWGSGVNGDALLAALKSSDLFMKDTVNQFAGCADAADVAKVIGGWSYNEAHIKNFADMVAANLTSTCKTSAAQADDAYVITVDAVGYYFVKDAQALTGSDAATDYLLQVVKSVEVAPKVSAPTFSKSVNNELDSTYVNAIDAQIGDTVYFKLETKLPSLYNDYKQYRMVMEDILPAGLTFNKVEDIYIAHAAGGHTSYLNSYTEDNATDATMAFAKKYGYDEATATLTVNFGDLKITQTNPNLNDTFVVKYSATVNTDAAYGLNGGLGNENQATLSFSNDMNQSDAATANLGSLTSTASVYVYQLEVTKQDTLTKAPLKGAQFYLFRNFTNTDGTTTKKYAHTDANGVITAWSTETPAAPMVSGDDGKFVIKGLDSLAYHLEEIKAPDGYNKMEDSVLVTLTATIDGQTLSALQCTADGSAGTGTIADGLAAVAVNNTAGATLPATGGMGTTIFYIAGAAMLLAVAVILVAKKRKEA